MVHYTDRHHRRSIRLKGYDHSQTGAYSVIICTHNRACVFGKVADGVMCLNRIREYIINNPLQWADDRENPAHIKAVRERPLPKDSSCGTETLRTKLRQFVGKWLIAEVEASDQEYIKMEIDRQLLRFLQQLPGN